MSNKTPGEILSSDQFLETIHRLMMLETKGANGKVFLLNLSEQFPANLDHARPEHVLNIGRAFFSFRMLRDKHYKDLLKIQRHRNAARGYLMRRLYNKQEESFGCPKELGQYIEPGQSLEWPEGTKVPSNADYAKGMIDCHPVIIGLNAKNDELEGDYHELDGICESIKIYWQCTQEFRRDNRQEQQYSSEPTGNDPRSGLRNYRKPTSEPTT